MSDDGSNRIESVLARLEKGSGPDRDLDWDIAEALGASIRRVGRLGLNGRSPGSWRAFFPKSDPRKGSAIPYYTKDREKAKAKLRTALTTTGAYPGGNHDT
ncbi:hypothetical protein AKG11_32735 [Shinella sp. SUS2]|uniref:hypothetical protein n=1 Tax=unclassified Shinella TaxID=2643062 RepID=UPI0006825C44|nr:MULTISPECIES: hypothetical protein [unclassified Shinella]KNY11868.1 hypothetical protein AKG11_32735 [Shinella sp. SUS2]KOC71548.1 hypothetical protein AKG10_32400 [Shinella sp. GWS1]